MPKTRLVILLCAAAVMISTAAAVYWGVRQERIALSRLLSLLRLQFEAELSKTVALPSMLGTHSGFVAILQEGGASSSKADWLDRLVLQTGQFSIEIVSLDGAVIASGRRKPEARPTPKALSSNDRAALNTGALARRFVGLPNGQWLFEAGRAMRGPGGQVAGYVLVSGALEDQAQTWRASPDRFIIQSNKGQVLFASEPFAPSPQNLLMVSEVSNLTNTVLTLERSRVVLCYYAVVGFGVSGSICLAIVFGLSAARRRKQIAEQKIASLHQDAELLERRVRERTKALLEEINRRERTEASLREKQAQLVQAGKFKVLGDMAAGLSHELSQPVWALISALGALEKQLAPIAKPAAGTLSQIKSVTSRIERILKNLRGFARNEVEAPLAVNVAEAIDAALEIMSPAANRLGAVIEHMRPEDPIICQAGPVRLQQVIVNVLSNALDAAAPQGGGWVRIEYAQTGAQCFIHIQDNGPGFEDAQGALKPFVTTKSETRGLGLGLPISVEILESFGGSLSLGNAPEGGAKVTIALNLTAAG